MDTTTSVRVNHALYKQAKSKEKLTKRKAPKQIEYWAELGQLIEERLNPEDLEAVRQGRAHVLIESKNKTSLLMRDLLHSPPEKKNGQEWFQASQDLPGCLVRVSPDGHRELGHFTNGKFVSVAASKKK